MAGGARIILQLGTSRRVRPTARVAVAAMIALAGSFQTAEAGVLDEPPARQVKPERKVAIDRARAAVLQVECTDPRAPDSPTILSAVAIDSDGHVVTVGLQSAAVANLRVCDCTGRRNDAQWIAADEHTGLTLLRVAADTAIAAPLGDAAPELGAPVFVVGNPFGLRHSVSIGNISGLERRVSVSGWTGRDLIQFTAPVFPGDSGGLLADDDGRMVGIVCMALGEPSIEQVSGERRVTGIGFAIPAAEVHKVVERLRHAKQVQRGYLGVFGEGAVNGGVRVARVADESPAQAAGIRRGDVIAQIDGVAVRHWNDIAQRLDELTPGTKVILRVVRDTEQSSIVATIGERPARTKAAMDLATGRASLRMHSPAARSWDWIAGYVLKQGGSLSSGIGGNELGVETQVVTEKLAKSLRLPFSEGALIDSVRERSPADGAGLRPSDLIVFVNDRPIKSPGELRESMREVHSHGSVRVGYIRNGRAESVAVELRGSDGQTGDSLTRPVVRPQRSHGEEGVKADAMEQRVQVLERRIQELEKQLRDRTGGARPPQEN